MSTGVCVVCVTNGDCGVGTICNAANQCVTGCDPSAPNCGSDICCGTPPGCVDPTSDPNNCNGCGNTCSGTNNTPTCSGGACVANCNAGWQNCTGTVAADGCNDNIDTDPDNCGGCTQACSGVNNTPTCSGGSCVAECTPGYQNCAGDVQLNGCETQIDGTDTTNCGGCGVVCSSVNVAVLSCSAGTCNSTCIGGWANCTGTLGADGCNDDIETDPNNCGGCTIVCNATNDTPSCSGGTCDSTCNGGYVDCNGNLQLYGCETCIDCGDDDNCGGCGVSVTAECPGYNNPECNGSSVQCCPYVFAFDGKSFVYETSIGGSSVVGKLSHIKTGKDLDFEPMWVRLDHSAVDWSTGAGVVRSKVIAAEDDIVYFDEAFLTAIEHPPGYEVVSSTAIEWQQTLHSKAPHEFYVLRTAALRTPVHATWMGGSDVTSQLSTKDEIPATFDVKLANYYDLDFGPVASPAANTAPRWLVIEGWKFKQKRELAAGVPQERPRLEVRQADGSWAKALDLATPKGDKKAAAFDLAGVSFPTHRYDMRIVTGTHEDGKAMWYLDRVRLAEEAALPARPRTVPLASATLSFMGPPSVQGLHEYWHPMHTTDDGKGELGDKYLTYGSFTRYGDVRELLTAPDDRFVVMRRGDGVELRFVGVPKATPGQEVTLFLETDLLFKPRELLGETAESLQQVEPLPYHGMGHYPPREPFPSDDAHVKWQAAYETRVYERGDTRWGK